MADSVPVFMPGTAQTLAAGGAISGGDLVTLSAANTVVKAATLASTAYIGVAGHDSASGSKVTVYILKGGFDFIADGTVTVGDQIGTTNTSNRQVKTIAASAVDVGATPTQTSINTAVNAGLQLIRGVIGTALTTANDNTTVRWVQH